MHTLTRRTAIAASAALAATAPLTTLAGTVDASTDPLKVSPRLTALAEEYHRMDGEVAKCFIESEQLNDAIKARGAVRPEGPPPAWFKTKAVFDVTGYTEAERREVDTWRRHLDNYQARYNAQPEVPRISALGERCDECSDRKWEIAKEIIETAPATLGDLCCQFEIWLEHGTERELDGSISQIVVDTHAEPFMLRLPSEIRRLAGRVS